MSYTNQELDIIQAIKFIGRECANFSEEECLEVWEFAMELQERCELYIG